MVRCMDAATCPLVYIRVPRVRSDDLRAGRFFLTTLQPERDYIEEDGSVWLTDAGVAYAEQYFRIKEFYSAENLSLTGM